MTAIAENAEVIENERRCRDLLAKVLLHGEIILTAIFLQTRIVQYRTLYIAAHQDGLTPIIPE